MIGIKIPYAIGFAIVGLFLCWLLPKARDSSKPIAKRVYHMLIATIILVFANLVQELSFSAGVSLVSYAIYFCSMSATLYTLLRFIMEYTAYPKERPLWLSAFEVLIVIDGISILSNIVTHHAFGVAEVKAETGETFYAAVQLPAFHVHLAIMYSLLAVSFILLIAKIINTPRDYWGRYFIFLGLIVGMLIWNSMFIIFKSVINQSVFGYAVFMAMTYYFSLVYVPRGLLDHLHSRIVNAMSEGVIFLDTDDRCIYANNRASELLNVKPADLEGFKNYLVKRAETKGVDFANDTATRFTEQRGSNTLFYDVECRHLRDSRGKSFGSIFTIQDRTESVRRYEEQKYLATHDPMTGIFNRRGFMEAAEEILESTTEDYSMVCTDIRDFKFINDLFGADRGDMILQRAAELYEELCGSGEVCGRLSADKFALLIRTNKFDDAVFLDTMNKISTMVVSSAYSIYTHAGVYEVVDRDASVSIMCDRANMAISTVRNENRNLIVYYNDDLKEDSLHEKQVLNEFEEAMTRGDFRIFLQPQFSADGALVGAEALVRWFHPTKGLLMPGAFVPILERAGMIYRLDRVVWELAVKQLDAWTGTEKEPLSISVNISSKDLYYIDLYSVFTGLVEQYHVDPSRLKLEITETALMKDIGAYNSLFARLHAYGFEVEMDDFGSGYSSLSMLKDIHVDILKIDMAFLQRTESVERGRIILRAMISLAKDLQMPVITEGVETGDQVAFLKELGCDMFQGYFFSKPVAIEELEDRYFPDGHALKRAFDMETGEAIAG